MAEELNDKEEFKRNTTIPSIKTNSKEGRVGHKTVRNPLTLKNFQESEEVFLRDQFQANDP